MKIVFTILLLCMALNSSGQDSLSEVLIGKWKQTMRIDGDLGTAGWTIYTFQANERYGELFHLNSGENMGDWKVKGLVIITKYDDRENAYYYPFERRVKSFSADEIIFEAIREGPGGPKLEIKWERI